MTTDVRTVVSYVGGKYQALIVDRVPADVPVEVHRGLLVEKLVHELSCKGYTVRRYKIVARPVPAPSGRPRGLHVRVEYTYNAMSPDQVQARKKAIRLGWETGLVFREFRANGSPEEIRSLGAITLSPYHPAMVHDDPEAAVVLHAAWIKGRTAGKDGKPCPA
ncbi:hypothetical protein CRM73_00330 [Kocuria sp. CCUG 69068]|uniref:hypothetical protein n=1 Tax=Kocuria sp. CCUG 69068 TaxID=2043138 RepID=UPI001E4BD281|nr:hypothetical protein [Kocuria sp. CCUG 69068]